jgi:hypothetical protein
MGLVRGMRIVVAVGVTRCAGREGRFVGLG